MRNSISRVVIAYKAYVNNYVPHWLGPGKVKGPKNQMDRLEIYRFFQLPNGGGDGTHEGKTLTTPFINSL